MADAAKNSLWGDMAAGKDIGTELMGPSYSYSDHIPSTGSLGVGSAGTFDQLGTNAAAIGTYVGVMVDSSTPMGDQFFVNTGGTCTAPDGSLQSRWNYVNNQASGLIEGVVGDVLSLDPLYLFSAITADSSPPCVCYKCNVTSGPQYRFLSPELSPDFSSETCTQVDSSNCMVESFSNRQIKSHSAIPVLIAATLLFFIFSGK
jgi:hypothetical protein